MIAIVGTEGGGVVIVRLLVRVVVAVPILTSATDREAHDDR